jgi:hypothetical protein
MLRRIKGIRNIPINLPSYAKIFEYLFVHQKDNPKKPPTKVFKTREEM